MNKRDNLTIRGILRTLSDDLGQSIASKAELMRLIKVLQKDMERR